MKLKLRILFSVSLAIGIHFFNTAQAWSGSGHKWVADLAWDQMTPEAQELTYQLLVSGQDIPSCEKDILSNVGNKRKAFIGASRWSDCVRDIPGFGMYHADRYPLCPGLGASACRSGRCATESLMQAISDLKNIHASQETRRKAVKTIIHLVGDLHQPLHVVATSPINMMVKNNENDKSKRLHEYWDHDVVVGAKANKAAVLNLIKEQSHSMTAGSWDDWMAETAVAGKKIAYGELLSGEANMCSTIKSVGNNPLLITEIYAQKAIQLGIQKTAQASVRLAYILNQAANNIKQSEPSPSKYPNTSA